MRSLSLFLYAPWRPAPRLFPLAFCSLPPASPSAPAPAHAPPAFIRRVRSSSAQGRGKGERGGERREEHVRLRRSGRGRHRAQGQGGGRCRGPRPHPHPPSLRLLPKWWHARAGYGRRRPRMSTESIDKERWGKDDGPAVGIQWSLALGLFVRDANSDNAGPARRTRPTRLMPAARLPPVLWTLTLVFPEQCVHSKLGGA